MTARPLMVGPMIHLGTLAPFRQVSYAQLTLIAAECEEVVYGEDGWLSRRGETIDAMHMILDGYVNVVGAHQQALLGPGSLIGFPDVLVPEPARLGVRADTDVLALRLETDALRDLCEHDFSILASLLSYLAERVTDDAEALPHVVAGSGDPIDAASDPSFDRVARMLALHRAPAFPAESMDALAELAGHVDVVHLGDRAELWSPGRVADGFWVVAEGSVHVSTADGIAYSVWSGGVPGLPETLAGRAYASRARAAAPTTLLSVGIDPFMDVLEDHFELAYSLLGWLATHLVAEHTR